FVVQRGQGHLSEVVAALDPPRRLADGLNRRQQQRDQNPDDRNDDQKLDQREAASPTRHDQHPPGSEVAMVHSGLSRFSRRGETGTAGARPRRENGTVPLALSDPQAAEARCTIPPVESMIAAGGAKSNSWIGGSSRLRCVEVYGKT